MKRFALAGIVMTLAAFAIVAHVMEAMPYLVTGPLTAIALRVSPGDIFFVYKQEVAAEVEAVAG